LPLTDKLPFFRANYGPHTWCDAAVTAQLVVPTYREATELIELVHVGFQLVPRKQDDTEKRLARAVINPSLHVKQITRVTSTGILNAFSNTLQFPWLDVCPADNLEHFVKLLDIYPNQKLMRISRYKSRGDANGN